MQSSLDKHNRPRGVMHDRRRIRETLAQVVPHEIDPFNPPAELRLDAGAVGRINWQPRWCTPPLECIASRRGDTLYLVFGWDQARRPLDGTKWAYRLGEPADGVVIARRIT